MEGSKDDWLFDSLYRYERLHMFELPHATRCLEWADQLGTSLYVGGFSDKHTNEIEMLELPEALQPQGQNNVCAHTDFKITCGGLTKSPVTVIKRISDMNVLATAGTGTCVSLWMKDPENSDLLALHTSLQLRNEPSMASSRPVLLDHTSNTPSWLLGAKTVGSATVWDLNSNLPISLPIHAHGAGGSFADDTAPLHGLKFVGPQLCVACSGEAIGTLVLWDLRSPTIAAQVQVPTPHRDKAITQGFALAVDRATGRVAVLSMWGEVTVFEARQLGAALCSCTLDCPMQRYSGGGRFSGLKSTAAANLCIEFSCTGTMVAVSGLTNEVSIYDTSSWTSCTQEVSPLFTHTGHEAECPGAVVLTHTWHPVFADTVLSADSEGNLHAWQWKSQLDK